MEFALRHDQGLPEEAEIETIGLRKDGSEFPFHAAVARFDLPDFPVVLGFFTDLTRIKSVEVKLRKSEDRFRTLIEQAPVAITISRNGSVMYVNPRHLMMFGYQDLDDICGHPITDLLAPQGSEERAMASNRRVSLGVLGGEENDLMGLRRDGSEFPTHVALTRMELADGPVIVAFITDITQRTNARKQIEELAAKEEKERIVLER